MRGLFSFAGRIGRLRFVANAIFAVLVEQIAYTALVGKYWFNLGGLLYPVLSSLFERWNALAGHGQGIVVGVPVGIILLCLWRLTAVSFRRARTTGTAPGLAALAMVPYVQLVVCALLAARGEGPPTEPDSLTAADDLRWQAVSFGIFSGVGIAVLGTIFSTLALGTYGLGLFVGVPFIMGFAVAYSANRGGNIGSMTYSAVTMALMLTGLVLTGFAIEGIVCILLAMPIALAMAMIGAWLGKAWVLRRNYEAKVMGTAWLLPVLLVVEAAAPPHARFESSESIEIAASPTQVWGSVVHMGPIPDRPAAPFGWGVAYPLRGVIRGSGVGAVREGVFSTGVAYEKVTVWDPGHRLYFDVLTDPPMMEELSPFGHVAAPHTVGYFKTRNARFTITPLANGRTRLTLDTSHELDIGPLAYFRPIADWAIKANKHRVLSHFKAQAEASAPQI